MINYIDIKKHIPSLITSLVFLILLYLLAIIDEESISHLTSNVEPFGIVIIGIFILLSQIFAPLSGTPGLFVGIKIYGYTQAMICFFIASMLSAVINFSIARFYGRSLIAQFVGEQTLNEVDTIAQLDQRNLLFFSRVFGYYFFDIVSYAIGLTSISFKKYFFYTFLYTLIPFTLQYVIFRGWDFSSFWGMLTYYTSLLITGGIFASYFYRVYANGQAGFKGE